MHRNRLLSIENNINNCIEILKQKQSEPLIFAEKNKTHESLPERGPKFISKMEFEHAGDEDSPTFIDEAENCFPRIKKNFSSENILEKLQQLSEKVNKLKIEEKNHQKSTFANVPKRNTNNKEFSIS